MTKMLKKIANCEAFQAFMGLVILVAFIVSVGYGIVSIVRYSINDNEVEQRYYDHIAEIKKNPPNEQWVEYLNNALTKHGYLRHDDYSHLVKQHQDFKHQKMINDLKK